MTATKRKPEDSAAGCRALAEADRERAAATGTDHMRECLERSAAAWTSRAGLLDRLEANFNARAAAALEEQQGRAAPRDSDNG